MILDLLPYKQPKSSRKNWGFIRYIIFTLSLVLIIGLFLMKIDNLDKIMFLLFYSW